MISERICFVYIVLPNTTEFITAARFQITQTRDGASEKDCDKVASAFVYDGFYYSDTR